MNCSQIFCTFAVETTGGPSQFPIIQLWIALKFFVLLQSKQLHGGLKACAFGCELLSNFLYFCSRNNFGVDNSVTIKVVNCSQIFCTFAVETTNKFRIAYTDSCELLSNFLYFCSRNNLSYGSSVQPRVVNCSQIFCTFAVETTGCRDQDRDIGLWIALKFFVLLQSKQRRFLLNGVPFSCELLSNFLYFCSRNNMWGHCVPYFQLWIALKFFVLLQSKQRVWGLKESLICCELLSNFLYFCSRNNLILIDTAFRPVVNCSQIFCTFAVETTHSHHGWRTGGLWIALKFFVLLQSKQLFEVVVSI